MATTFIFACTQDCADEIAFVNDLGEYGEWRYVMGVEDIAGHRVESLDFLTCGHRWKPATRTAYLHMEACIYALGDIQSPGAPPF